MFEDWSMRVQTQAIHRPAFDFEKQPAMAMASLCQTWCLAAIICTPLALAIGSAMYNIFLHPLAAYPGPPLYAASDIPYILMVWRGRPHEKVLELHRKYGGIVRIAPNELSFIQPEAWNELMNPRAGDIENNKDTKHIDPSTGSIISASRQNHARMRNVLSDGFSTRAVASYLPIIQKHAKSLVEVLSSRCHDGQEPLDMVTWSHFTLIDIVYELTMGLPYGCLETQRVPPCVDFAFSCAKLGAYYQCLLRLPGSQWLMWLLIPPSVKRRAIEYQSHLKDQIQERLTDTELRTDFVGLMLRGKLNHTMSMKEIHTTTEVMIIGGSETTASALCAVLFFLATQSDCMKKAVDEIFSVFQREDEASIPRLSQLPYLRAVINESLRLHPPSPVALPRRTPPGGNTLFGRHIPGDTVLGFWQFSAYHNARNFKFPSEFHPERWLGDSRFENDQRDVFKPFSAGPRNCIGLNVAMIELQLILVHLIWNFEFKVAKDSLDWLSQDVFLLWQKRPLNMHFTPRSRSPQES